MGTQQIPAQERGPRCCSTHGVCPGGRERDDPNAGMSPSTRQRVVVPARCPAGSCSPWPCSRHTLQPWHGGGSWCRGGRASNPATRVTLGTGTGWAVLCCHQHCGGGWVSSAAPLPTPRPHSASRAGARQCCLHFPPPRENHSDLATITTFRSWFSCCLQGLFLSLAWGWHPERFPPYPWAPSSKCAIAASQLGSPRTPQHPQDPRAAPWCNCNAD